MRLCIKKTVLVNGTARVTITTCMFGGTAHTPQKCCQTEVEIRVEGVEAWARFDIEPYVVGEESPERGHDEVVKGFALLGFVSKEEVNK